MTRRTLNGDQRSEFCSVIITYLVENQFDDFDLDDINELLLEQNFDIDIINQAQLFSMVLEGAYEAAAQLTSLVLNESDNMTYHQMRKDAKEIFKNVKNVIAIIHEEW